MPDEHALLGASSSKRWLHCTPSVRLEEGFPNESSVFAAEGTFAHEVCEYKVRKYLHERVKRPQSEEFYTEEIDQITDVYAEFVITVIEEMRRNGCEPLVLVEKRVDYSHIAPSGFGTADMIVIGSGADGKGLLHIFDFKTGKGVYVDCDHNSQMMLYALGALHEYGYIYPIETVRMSIIQPRLDNVGTFECSRDELEAWGESIRPIARMAYEGKGEQRPGDWCRFCRAKPVCRACADYVSFSGLSDALQDYVASSELSSYLSEALSDYLSETDVTAYLSEGLAGLSEFIRESDLSDALSDYLSESDITAYLSNGLQELTEFVRESDLSDTLSDYMSESDVSEYVSDALSNYLSESDVTYYVSEGLAVLSEFMRESDLETAGYVSSSSFAAALAAYLSDYGGETIYNAISQYINPES